MVYEPPASEALKHLFKNADLEPNLRIVTHQIMMSVTEPRKLPVYTEAPDDCDVHRRMREPQVEMTSKGTSKVMRKVLRN